MRSISAFFVFAVTVVMVLGSLGQASAATTRIGPVAKVRGEMDGTFTVKVTVHSNDTVRVCIRGKGLLPEGVAKVQFNGKTRQVRRSYYDQAGCQTRRFKFAQGTPVTYRACFADPRTPKKLLCGKLRVTTAA